MYCGIYQNRHQKIDWNTKYIQSSKEIEFPMHKAGNTLDWIIHKEELNCTHNLTKLEFLSDHCIIEWQWKKYHHKLQKLKNNVGI